MIDHGILPQHAEVEADRAVMIAARALVDGQRAHVGPFVAAVDPPPRRRIWRLFRRSAGVT